MGKSGSDVASLQEGLRVPVSGVLDWQTLEAIRGLYAKAEVIPPGGWWDGTFVKLSEFASLPPSDGPPVVRTIAKVGSLLDSNATFAEIGTGVSFAKVRASVSEADRITVGSKARIQAAGSTAETGVVTAIGEFQSERTTDGRPPGKDIRISLPKDTRLMPGQVASVLFGAESKPSTAVPTLAIRSDSSGEYVLRRTAGEKPERVPVVVLRNANGWTALDVKALNVGDEVLVSQ